METEQKILEEGISDFEKLANFAATCPKKRLFEIADGLRRRFLGNAVDTCSIMNARSGRCSENCKWCAQSAHNDTGCDVYPCVTPEEAVGRAKKSRDAGIMRFSLVTSGRTLSQADTERMAECFRAMSKLGGIALCGSFGLLDESQLKILKEAGMSRLHCNLETAPSKFPELCSTHTIEEKIATLRAARKVGLSLCSGGIIGMGETLLQRAELACVLRDIGVDSIPVNILQPIPGTPLENARPLSGDEILEAFALFRIANPRAHIRFAGGRSAIKSRQEEALRAGVSGVLMGDMLTTLGSSISEDFATLKRLGYEF